MASNLLGWQSDIASDKFIGKLNEQVLSTM